MGLGIFLFLLMIFILMIIGVGTNHWFENISRDSFQGLWWFCSKLDSSGEKICQGKPWMKSQIFSLISLSFFFIGLIHSFIQLVKDLHRRYSYLTLIFLVLSILFLMFSYLYYPMENQLKFFGYSIYCLLISTLFIFCSIFVIVFHLRSSRE